jgi:hypothetical protein
MKTSKGRMDRGKGKEGVRAKGNEREKKQWTIEAKEKNDK